MKNSIDTTPKAVVSGYVSIEKVNRARRWIRGAALLLADAGTGDKVIESIACDAANLAFVVEAVLIEYQRKQSPFWYPTGMRECANGEGNSGKIR